VLQWLIVDATEGTVERLAIQMGKPGDDTTQLQVLLDLAAEGDKDAYGELIGRASKRLLKLTRKMLRNYPHLRRWEQTDDVFQNAAIRLCRSLEQLKPDSVRSFFGLATVEIRRALIDLIRHHFGPEGAAGKHHSDVIGESNRDGSVLRKLPDHTASPRSLEAWAGFHEAVEQLPATEREVFHLVWYGGMEQKEAASVLGVSVPTVQRRLYRARHLISSSLHGEQPPVEE